MTRAESPFTRIPAVSPEDAHNGTPRRPVRSSVGPAADGAGQQTQEEKHRENETRGLEIERRRVPGHRCNAPTQRHQCEQNRPSHVFRSLRIRLFFAEGQGELRFLNRQPKCQALNYTSSRAAWNSGTVSVCKYCNIRRKFLTCREGFSAGVLRSLT